MTFTRMATHRREVAPVLVPIVTSATVTAEQDGNFTTRLPEDTVVSYLDAALSVGAGLMLQIQPGRATLEAAVEKWQELLDQPDVGLILDLRSHVAFNDQAKQLESFVSLFSGSSGNYRNMGLLVISDGLLPVLPNIVEPIVISLSDGGGAVPHDAIAEHPRARALIYA